MFRDFLKACTGVTAGLLALTAVSSAQEIKLNLADQNSPNSFYSQRGILPWVKRVEEATKGRVKIQVYPSQTLAKGPDMWRAVKSGIVDIGWCFHGYWPDMTPLADALTLPFLPFATADKGSSVMWQLFEKFPAMQKDFNDVKVLMIWTSDPYILLTKQKPVKTLEDWKGLKVRATGGPPTDQVKALGGVPMLIPMPDVYDALDKGVIDGASVPWEAIHGFRFYEVGRHYTVVPMSAVVLSLTMNKAKWNSLPKDIQDAIMSVSGLEGSRKMGSGAYDGAEKDVMELVKKGNYTMNRYDIPAAELARWSKVAGEPLWQDWVKKMQAKGRPEAKEILDTALQLLK